MKSSFNRTLVLTLCGDQREEAIFAGDLYSGNSVIDSVYLDRAALLRWLIAQDAEAGGKAARAMDELLMETGRTLRSVPVGPGSVGSPR